MNLHLGYLDASRSSVTSAAVSLRCTNPYDPYVYIYLTVQRHQRRIAIVVFQFMEQKTNLYLKEDVSILECTMGLNGLDRLASRSTEPGLFGEVSSQWGFSSFFADHFHVFYRSLYTNRKGM